MEAEREVKRKSYIGGIGATAGAKANARANLLSLVFEFDKDAAGKLTFETEDASKQPIRMEVRPYDSENRVIPNRFWRGCRTVSFWKSTSYARFEVILGSSGLSSNGCTSPATTGEVVATFERGTR